MTFKRAPTSISNLQIAVSVVFGTVALVVLGLQPLLYTAYVYEGTISGQRLGLLGAAELIAIAGGSALSVHFLRQKPVIPIALAGIAIMVAANAAHLDHGGTLALFLRRAVAGAGAGLLVGLAAASIAQARRIGAWAGAYLFGQALSQYALMRGFASFRPDAASTDIQWALALCAAAALFLTPFLPRSLNRVATSMPDIQLSPTPRGFIGLGSMFLCVGATGGIWGYLELWLHSKGVPQSAAAHILSVALLGQIVGALAGAFIADGRLVWLRLIFIMSALAGTVALWLANPDSSMMAFAFGLLFMLGAPSFTGILPLLDPEHRAVPYGATAQLAGIAVIPTIVGETLAEKDLTLVIVACIAVIVAGVLLLLTQTRWFLDRTRIAQTS